MVTVVTSMSLKGYETYGKCFLESFMKYAPISWSVDVWSEDELPIFYYRLQEVPGYEEFKNKAASVEAALPEDFKTNYRYQASRFCNKPFSLYGSFTVLRRMHGIYWFDADVEFMQTPSEEVLKVIAPPFAGVSILNRSVWPHSEGGFVGIGIGAESVIDIWYSFYRTGTIFKLKEWHDVMAMDVAIALSKVYVNNLSSDPIEKHVWPHSPLGTFSVHHKGPGRKTEKFGTEIGGATLTDKVMF